MTQFTDFCDQNAGRITAFAVKFNSYVFPIDEFQIRNWLKQFGENNVINLELGLKLLDKIDYFSPARLVNEARDLHQLLLAAKQTDVHSLLNKPTYFVNFSLSSGHSQDELTPKYRLGSNLRHIRYDPHFLHLSDINMFLDKDGIKKGISLVFLTDFIGSGKQASDTWDSILWEISPENEHILLSICGYDSGINKIRQETKDQLCPMTCRTYSNRNRVFANDNMDFTPAEKDILRELCERAGEDPTGFLDVQSSTVFCFRCPNDSISILRANNANWVGLFKRYGD